MQLNNWYYVDGRMAGIDSEGNEITTDRIIYTEGDIAIDASDRKYLLGNPFSDNFAILIKKVEKWAEDRGIFENSVPKDQALKTVSEVGEFADNVLKGRDCRDDIGDIIVTLILQCRLQNTTLYECLTLAYEEIAARKGKMVNGTFVKESDNN